MNSPAETITVPVAGSDSKSEAKESYGLRSQVLSPFETLAQSVANIAPTGTPTVVIPLVFALSGAGTWLAYLIAMISILFVALSINVFARRSASPGALYTYIAAGLGPGCGVFAGWALFIAYAGTGAAVTTGFSNYANVLLQHLTGRQLHSPVLIALSVAVSCFIAYKDIKLSTRMMLLLEFSSVGLILVLIIATILKSGLHFDIDQFTLKGISLDSLRQGLVLATFSFVGFESATTLGSEARNPLRSIPRAVALSAVLIGFLFVFSSYSETLAFRGEAVSLDKSNAPLHIVANKVGLSFLGILIDIGAVISFFACILACINAGARVLFLMGRHGIFHSSVGDFHQTNETPHVAVAVSSLLVFIPPFILSLLKVGDFDIYGWVGTVATISFIIVYIAILVAAPIYLARRQELKTMNIVIAFLGALFLINALAGNLYPVPSAPYNWLPYFTFALLAAGAVWYLALQFFSPVVNGIIGNDLAAIDERYRDGGGI